MIEITLTIPDTEIARTDIEERAKRLREAYELGERKRIEREAKLAPAIIVPEISEPVNDSQVANDRPKKRGPKPKSVDAQEATE